MSRAPLALVTLLFALTVSGCAESAVGAGSEQTGAAGGTAAQADPTPEAYEALQREFSAYCANLSGAFGKALASRSKLTVAFQKLTEGMWRHDPAQSGGGQEVF